MVGWDFNGGCAHALGELALGVGRDRLVAVGDQVPGRQRFPRRYTHHVLEGGGGQRLLHGVHDLCLDRVDVSGEVVDEIVLWDPSEALAVDDEMRECWGRGSLLQQRADRFALVKSERRDVDQTNDVRRVGAERGHDLTAVGVPGDHRRATLKAKHVAQSRDVVGERCLGKLGSGDVVAVGLEALDDRAPAGAVGPRAVDEDDVR